MKDSYDNGYSDDNSSEDQRNELEFHGTSIQYAKLVNGCLMNDYINIDDETIEQRWE